MDGWKTGLRSQAALPSTPPRLKFQYRLVVHWLPIPHCESRSGIWSADIESRRVLNDWPPSTASGLRKRSCHDLILSYLSSKLDSHPSSHQCLKCLVNELVTSSGPVVITDQLASPADFLLHRLLSEHVKSSKCIIVSTAQDVAQWKAISTRSVS